MARLIWRVRHGASDMARRPRRGRGDKAHAEAASMKHLSAQQQQVVKKANEDMAHSTARKGAHLGRRL
eukprot:4596787-Prymnesium_polylepis.1